MLYALILIFAPTADAYTEERYADNLSFVECDAAQRAVWAMEAPTVGYDNEGRAIPSIDAACVVMEHAPLERLTTYRVE